MEIKIKKLQEASGSRSLSRATSGSELSHISEDTEAPVPANGGAAVADGATPSDTSAALGQMMAQSQEAASREELIKNHYSTRISQLIEQVKFADSKAIAFHDECRNYALRLEVRIGKWACMGEEEVGRRLQNSSPFASHSWPRQRRPNRRQSSRLGACRCYLLLSLSTPPLDHSFPLHSALHRDSQSQETKGKISTLHEALETTKKNYEEQVCIRGCFVRGDTQTPTQTPTPPHIPLSPAPCSWQ